MRRSMAVLAALACMIPPLHAQGGLGVKGGLSFGNVSNRGLLPGNLDTRTGFAVGFALVPGGSLLGIGVEGLYAQRGVEGSNPPDSRKLDYVDVPAYLNVAIPLPALAPFAYAGPQLSFELRCRTGNSACPATDRPKTTFAAVIGGGVRLGARRALSVEGRYVYGLTDLKLSTITSSASYKTRSFLLLAGFAF